MIPNQWYVALETKEVKKGKLVGVTRLGERLVFWRNKRGEIICLRDKCAHRGAALSAGKICGNGDTVQCPFHGLEYDNSGKCINIPANGRITPVPEQFKVNSYPTNESHGFIWIWWGDQRESYPPLPMFEDIDEKFPYKTHTEVWPVHYSRAIENQLDGVHLPFVHRSTIGRGNKTIIHGPYVQMSEDKNDMKFFVDMQKDDGNTRALKPNEFPKEKMGKFYIQFKFPNLWQNHLTDKFRIFISFVPIDEEHTQFYMRFYQKAVKIPLLKGFINWLGIKFSNIILHQDRRVVITQRPIKTWLNMGEKLFPGDIPIVKYRQRREELLNEVKKDN